MADEAQQSAFKSIKASDLTDSCWRLNRILQELYQDISGLKTTSGGVSSSAAGGTFSGKTTTIVVNLTDPLTSIASPHLPSDGEILHYVLVQDSVGGRLVEWATDFVGAPTVINVEPNANTQVFYIGVGGKWIYIGSGAIPTAQTPFQWNAGYEAPVTGDSMRVAKSFGVQPFYEVQENGQVGSRVLLYGKPPLSELSTVGVPEITSTVVATPGGTIGVGSYVICAAAFENSGKSKIGPLSSPIVVNVAAGSTNKITVTVKWPASSFGGQLFVATTDTSHGMHWEKDIDAGVSTNGTTVSYDLTAISGVEYGPPDSAFDLFEFRVSDEAHGGVWGAACTAVGATTLTFSATFTVNQFAGCDVSLFAYADITKKTAVANLRVDSNTATTLTIGANDAGVSPADLTTLFTAGDVFVMRTKPTAHDSASFTDDNFVNNLSPSGLTSDDESGNIVVVISGKGSFQAPRVISNVTGGGTKVNLTAPWEVEPDSTSRIVILRPALADLVDTNPMKLANYTNYSEVVGRTLVNNFARSSFFVQAITVNRQGYASYFWDYREIYLPGVQGNRTVTASGAMRTTDGTVLFDTSSVAAGTSTTITADIDAVVLTIPVASGANIKNGTYIKIGTEKMFVTAGEGTTSLTIESRGGWGTTPASHTNGDTVNVPGILTFDLLPLASVPNQTLVLSKITTDIQAVKLIPDGSETFSGGLTVLYLADDTTAHGIVTLKSAGTVWVVAQSGGGTQGPAGPPGVTTPGTLAPNITSATGTISYEDRSSKGRQIAVLGGVITLPTGDPEYSHLTWLEIQGVDPDGQSHLLAQYHSGDWGGATITYAVDVTEQPGQGEASQTWDFRFVCHNESFAPTSSPFTISAVTIAAAYTSSSTGAEIGPRTQDEFQSLQTVVGLKASLANSQYPASVTFWVDQGHGFVWFNWYKVTAPTDEFTMNVYVPTNPAYENWQVAAAFGEYLFEEAIPASASIDAFTVSAPVACLADDVTGAQFIPNDLGDLIDYAKDSAGIDWWHWHELDWNQPSFAHDPNYWFSFFTVQKGYESGGVWHPAPDLEGSDDDATLYHGRWVTDSNQVLAGEIYPSMKVQLVAGSPDWTFPPIRDAAGNANPYRTFRFWFYAASQLNRDPTTGGSFTLQTGCWPGGADHYDLTPAEQPPSFDARVIAPSSLGSGLTKDGTGRPAPNTGIGIYVDGSGFIRVKQGQGITADLGTGVYIANSGLSNQFFAALSIATANLQNTSVTQTKIANLAVATAHIQFGAITTLLVANGAITNLLVANGAIANANIQSLAVATANIQDLAVTNAKIQTIQADKITGGIISATITLTSPTLVIASGPITVNIDSINLIKISHSGTFRTAQVSYAYFRVQNDLDVLNYAQLGMASISLSGPSGIVTTLITHDGVTWTNGTSYSVSITSNTPRLRMAVTGAGSYCQMDTSGFTISSGGPLSGLRYDGLYVDQNDGFGLLRVVRGRQAGPGNTTDATDVAFRFNTLLTALRSHGLIT